MNILKLYLVHALLAQCLNSWVCSVCRVPSTHLGWRCHFLLPNSFHYCLPTGLMTFLLEILCIRNNTVKAQIRFHPSSPWNSSMTPVTLRLKARCQHIPAKIFASLSFLAVLLPHGDLAFLWILLIFVPQNLPLCSFLFLEGFSLRFQHDSSLLLPDAIDLSIQMWTNSSH